MLLVVESKRMAVFAPPDLNLSFSPPPSRCHQLGFFLLVENFDDPEFPVRYLGFFSSFVSVAAKYSSPKWAASKIKGRSRPLETKSPYDRIVEHLEEKHRWKRSAFRAHQDYILSQRDPDRDKILNFSLKNSAFKWKFWKFNIFGAEPPTFAAPHFNTSFPTVFSHYLGTFETRAAMCFLIASRIKFLTISIRVQWVASLSYSSATIHSTLYSSSESGSDQAENL